MTASPAEGAPNISVAVKRAAARIVRDVFADRTVRISFCEKRMSREFGPRLLTDYVTARDEANHVFNYPLSIAGWALAEGRIISWPEEQSTVCDFERLSRLGKLVTLDRLVADDRYINAPPYLARAADIAMIKAAFKARELTLGMFYQDWNSWSSASRYSQFLSLPVPVVDLSPDDPTPPDEFGVFNIDTFDDRPLLDEVTEPLLRNVSAHLAETYASRA